MKDQCVLSIPTTFTVYENPNDNSSYRTIKDNFFDLYNEYDTRYWTLANNIYPTADDAYNNRNPYPRDVVARMVRFEITNPAIFYLRLDENLLQDARKIVIKYQANYSVEPPVRFNFNVVGCKLDDNTNSYNLNKALLDI